MSNIGNKETMAKNLKFYIERSGLSQKELAETVGVATSTFNDWVKGKKYPRIDKIEILANYFGILKSDLIEEKKEAVDTNGFGESKRLLLDFAMSCTEEQAERVLKTLKMIENILGSK